ncbi:MAG: hypothetical protein ACK6D3_24730 [Planctomycetaceae bacterium]
MISSQFIQRTLLRRLAGLAVALCLGFLCGSAFTHGADSVPGVLRLRDGSQFDARWQTITGTGAGLWSTQIFEQPLRLPAGVVESYSRPGARALPLPEEFWEALLSDGSRVRGRLVSFDRRQVVLQGLVGSVPIALDSGAVVELRRRSGLATVAYPGLEGLRGWRDEWGRSQAFDRRGALQLEGPGILGSDVGLPERSVSDVEIRWRGRPNFGMQWGVRTPEAPPADVGSDTIVQPEPKLEAPPEEQQVADPAQLRPFNLEVHRGELLALAETQRGVIQQPVQTLSEPGGRLVIRVYLDQRAGRMVVTTPTGKVLCDLAAPEPRRSSGGAVRLVNGRGAVRLEGFRVLHWDGRLPVPAPDPAAIPTPPQPRERTLAISAQDEVRFDRELGGWLVKGRSSQPLPESEIDLVVRSPADQAPPKNGNTTGSLIELVDGSQWRGEWRGAAGNIVLSQSPLVGSWEISANAIRRITWEGTRSEPSLTAAGGVPGMLQNETVALAGTLVGVRATERGPRLEWQPPLGIPAALLSPTLSARLLFREVTSPRGKRTTSEGRTNDGEAAGLEASSDPSPDSPRLSLRLLTGETLACRAVDWQDGKLEITLPKGELREFAESDLQSLDFMATDPDGSALSGALREALLTIPRQRQGNPPTHLVRSQTGDFLRGRLSRIDAQEIVLEVRGQEQHLPLTVVAAIVWLHPPPELSEKGSGEGGAAPARQRLHAWHRGQAGVGVTPVRLENSHLVCEDSLGQEVILSLAEIDGLLLGEWLARDARSRESWRWKPAVKPRFVEDDVVEDR